MIFLLIWMNILFSHVVNVYTLAVDNQEICFVILTQANEYHEINFLKKKRDILEQIEELNQLPGNIFRSYDLIDKDVGHWTIFPLLDKLSSKDCNWLFFMEEFTSIDLKKLLNIFRKYNSSEELFVGHALHDKDPTIIHHFADPASLSYPHFSAGFFISKSLLQRLVLKLLLDEEYSFSIDPKYEFAKFVWDSGNGVKLRHESQFCLTKESENCATWISEEFPDCSLPLPDEKLHVAVKTCHRFHLDRINVVKNTWAAEAKNLKIFSDHEDNSIPSIKVTVENVAHGHCEKTLSILRYYIENEVPLLWLAIVDDDTIISIKRLRKLLSCYNASGPMIIGERYGYGVSNGVGYDYITGGGGMIFSLPVIKMLVEHCECPSIDSPDDMIIGLCLKRFGIPVTHSPYFHQARPIDYCTLFLKPLKHISFHKHWMIDPYHVFQEWFQDGSDSVLHSEL